jgi:GNAT superfamily N-acetyltransferase
MHDVIKKSEELEKNESLLRIQIESIDQFYPDAKDLFEKDWIETTSGKISFEIDEDEYRILEKQKRLIIFAARYNEKLAGYINFVSTQSMHHKKNIANCAGFYVSKEHRGKTGKYLLDYSIKFLKSTHINKIRVSSPVKNDIGKFLERNGFEAEETIYGLFLA